MNQGFEIEPLYNVGGKVRIKSNGVEGIIKSVDLVNEFVTITDGQNIYWAGGFNNTCCIDFELIEHVEVESFEDIQMSWTRNVGNVPQSVTYPYADFELAYRHLVKLHDLVSDYKCNYDLITIKRDRNAKR